MNNEISILIVEDEKIWIECIQKILNDFVFNIAGVARNVQEALDAFGTVDYDLALVDIQLHGRNTGIELGKVLKTTYNKPFIFITASGDHELEAAAQVGPSAYLTKPVSQSTLFIAIQNAIQNHAAHKAANVSGNRDEGVTFFFVKHGNRYKKVEWKNVAYLSSGKNYVTIFNVADKTEYYIRSSLQKTLRHIIPASLRSQFIQVNRADVVQLSFIQEFTGEELKTEYKALPVSEVYCKELKSKLNIIS